MGTFVRLDFVAFQPAPFFFCQPLCFKFSLSLLLIEFVKITPVFFIFFRRKTDIPYTPLDLDGMWKQSNQQGTHVAISPSATAAALSSLTKAMIATHCPEVNPKQDDEMELLMPTVVATAGIAEDCLWATAVAP